MFWVYPPVFVASLITLLWVIGKYDLVHDNDSFVGIFRSSSSPYCSFQGLILLYLRI